MSDESAWEEVRALRAELKKAREERDALRGVLVLVKGAIHAEAADTLWMPGEERVQTVCDFIDTHLATTPPDFTFRMQKENTTDGG
ncbi:MAG: hypothetical protein ACRD68_00080 [Pyrinomonadaceae bacterium]